MNRYLKAAIGNMQAVENGDVAWTPKGPLTQAAIAYALIAIAEMMQEQNEAHIEAWNGVIDATAMNLLAPNRINS